MSEPRKYRPATRVAHVGRDPRKFLGAVNTPVFRASTILFPNVATLERAARGEFEGLTYGLHGLPTVRDFQAAIAELEGGHAALAVPSGLTATTLPLLALAHPGDHVLVTDNVYGPTRRFCDNHLRRFGVEVGYFDPLAGAALTHAHGAKLVLDNSWATPLGFRAFDHGVDIAVHAATKYIGGHSDVLLGAIVASEATYPALRRIWTDMGIAASTDDCFLGLRGLRTLAVRLHRHRENALAVAQWLATRSEVREVLYPALPGSRGHELWKRDFLGASGLFGVVLQPVDKARIDAMLDGMRLFAMGWSWGGYESMIIPTWPERSRTATRWTPGGPCLRLAVGLEDSADLIADLEAGFARLAG